MKYAERKLFPDLGPNIFIKRIQPNRLGKDIITLPIHGNKTHQVITNSVFVPHIILDYHKFDVSPKSHIFVKLSEIISELCIMATYFQEIINKNLEHGKMKGIVFRYGSDLGKTGGML